MNLVTLCALGTESLAAKALSGELDREHLWTAMDGATKYREAVAAGDVASKSEQRRRLRVGCRGCERITTERSAMPGVTKWYCGRAFEDRTAEGGTCGCLVALRVMGRTLAAGKVVVGSERCPMGRW